MKIIWIDDEWNSKNERIYLSDVSSGIENLLKDNDIEVMFDFYYSAGEAVAEIDRNSHEYKFAIVDIVFKEQKITYEYITNKLSEKRIHYIIYSNAPENYKNNDRFCIGKFGKGKDNADLVMNRLLEFFLCPPFRLLHLSDLHFSSKKLSSNDQDKRLNSLMKKLSRINDESKIDIVLFSGDIAAKNPANDITTFSTKLKEIMESLKMINDQAFIVPGNHDIEWDDFPKKDITKEPYAAFIMLLNNFHSKTVLSSYSGWRNRCLATNLNADDLSWNRELYSPRINIIGVSSVSTSGNEQGAGVFSEENIEFIRDKWEDKKDEGEFRIFLAHHNILSVLSYSSRDEKMIAYNSGTILNALYNCDCDLVISGHTHRSEVVSYTSSSLNFDGYNKGKNIVVISVGSSGHGSNTQDFASNFNVIDISKNIDNKSWRLEVTPFLYDSRNDGWNTGNSIELDHR